MNIIAKLSSTIFVSSIATALALVPLHAAPVANAGADTSSAFDVPIILDGSNSTNLGGGSLAYYWEQLSGEPVELIGQDRAKAMIISASRPGIRLFRLKVSSGNETATDNVVVNVLEANGRVLYVDNVLLSNCLNNNYSIAKRDGTGTDGNAYKSLQQAADIALPGDRIYVRGGTYADTLLSNNYLEVVHVTRSGTAQQPIRFQNYNGEKVILSGFGFQDGDLNGDGLADGPNFPAKRETLFLIHADYVQVVGFELRNSQQAGLTVQGSFCYIEECSSHDNWGSNFSLISPGSATLQGNVFRHNEGYRSRHDAGFVMYLNPQSPGFVRENAIVDCLFYDNGYMPDGNLVSKTQGDSSGGGNSDGFVISKSFYDKASSNPSVDNYGPDNFVIRNIVYHNSDDGFDFSFADSLVEDNMSILNGPKGTQGFKVFNRVGGLVFRGNVAYENFSRGFDFRAPKDGVVTCINNSAVRNSGFGLTGSNAASDVRNNLCAFNKLLGEFSSPTGPGENNWASDGKNVDKVYSGDPTLVDDNFTLDMAFASELSVGQKWEFVASQVKGALAPRPGSGLIDQGQIVPGYHCPNADDDPVSPMPKSAPGRHWYGRAPDIGAVEFNRVRPRSPTNLRVVQ